MPLPPNGIAWPPAELSPITAAMRVWDAWYTGDPSELTKVYRGVATPARFDRPAQYRGGIAGAAARFFWGRPIGDLQQTPGQLHIPIASDIARAAADLIWSEAPTITAEDEGSQKRLDELVDDGALATLAEGAELGSALGGHYVKVAWDTTIRNDPFLVLVDADAAWPEFRYGHLVAVTFWWVVAREGQKVTRHLERHELNALGVGIILHGLYEGTEDSLGVAVPLAEHSSTAGLAEHVDQDSAISTESPGLAVTYLPNVTPQRRWRNDPIGRHLGRSDLDGIEGLMDAVDEAWTSWMRDIRLGKARVFASRELLQDNGPGRGASFDLDRELFSPLAPAVGSLNMATSTGNANGFLMAQQFEIRYEEHKQTVNELVLTALRAAGYSAATFGEADGYGAAVTATEVAAREQRSLLTRDRKLRVIRPRLADILEKLLAVDAAIFKSSVKPARPDVQFPDGVQDSPLVLAQTAAALSGAEAASRETLVAMIHPEWDDEQVTEEVGRIAAERKLPAMVDPLGGFAPDQGATGDDAADA